MKMERPLMHITNLVILLGRENKNGLHYVQLLNAKIFPAKTDSLFILLLSQSESLLTNYFNVN